MIDLRKQINFPLGDRARAGDVDETQNLANSTTI